MVQRLRSSSMWAKQGDELALVAACDVCVRAGKIGDKAGIDDVPNAPEHDWNRCSCTFGREGGGCSPGHDQVHGQRNQLCGKVGVAFLTALRGRPYLKFTNSAPLTAPAPLNRLTIPCFVLCCSCSRYSGDWP